MVVALWLITGTRTSEAAIQNKHGRDKRERTRIKHFAVYISKCVALFWTVCHFCDSFLAYGLCAWVVTECAWIVISVHG